MGGISHPRKKYVHAMLKSLSNSLESNWLFMRLNCADDGAETCLGDDCPVQDECIAMIMLDSDVSRLHVKAEQLYRALEEKFPFLT